MVKHGKCHLSSEALRRVISDDDWNSPEELTEEECQGLENSEDE